MTCQKCGSERIASVNGKTSDLCYVDIGNAEHDGYVPDDIGIGGGDCIDFTYCLDCGQIQGTFPLALSSLEIGEDYNEDEDD